VSAGNKRQTTMAKVAREQALRARRSRNQAKKDARKLAAEQGEAGSDGVEPVATLPDGAPPPRGSAGEPPAGSGALAGSG
jgi:uncharacterized protein with von Willebrand factor type A (vWA) domain